jgi:hypothetical protein
MKIPRVPLAAWGALYDAALELRDLTPWRFLYDDQLFGMKDPVTGQTGYCCVLGSLGEVLALCVYRGSEGLEFYQRIQSGTIGPGDDEIIAGQNAILAEFADRRDLEKADISVLKSLNLTIRGRKQYPRFRSYRPGYSQWFLNEEEVGFLTLALKASCRFARDYLENQGIMQKDTKHCYLTYRPQRGEDGTVSWAREWIKPEPIPDPPAARLPCNEIRLHKIKQMYLKPDIAWEADGFLMPGIIRDRDRPYFARILAVAHHDSGFILSTNLAPYANDPCPLLTETILSAIETHKLLPCEIKLASRHACEAVKSLAESLGFKITLSKNLKSVKRFKTGLNRQSATGFPDLP